MTHQPDQLIDRALQSLRDTQPPPGLEARVSARLAQAADSHAITSSNRASSRSPLANTFSRASFFAVILSITKDRRILFTETPLHTLAATALLVIALIAVNHHHKPKTLAHSNPLQLTLPPQPAKAFSPAKTQALQGFSTANTLVPQGFSPANTLVPQGFSPANTLVPQGFSPANTLVPQGFSLGSHRISKEAGVLTPAFADDPDALALAETLAPSHPAPSMPLTAQEHLLVLATRQGQPMELAAIDTLRQPALQAAAEARQNATIRRYVQSLLGPLAAAEALNPTSPSVDDTPSPQPPSSK
jgi:hypothetical protein